MRNVYEVFDHTADLGLRITAPSVEQLFAEAGQGLFSVIVANLDAVEAAERAEIRIEGERNAYLLFDWLNELLYIFDSSGMVLSEFEITMCEDGLEAVAYGEPLDAERHGLEHEVKAITYHKLDLEQTENGWQAQVIVDI